MVGITLLHRKGYFKQKLDESGWQQELPAVWNIQDFLEETPVRTSVKIEGREIHLRTWKYEVKGITGFVVPVYFLDADLPENSEWDRTLTDYLYGGDDHYRLCQEVILGIGGVRMLGSLGYQNVQRYHMNEGHAALLGLELLDREAQKNGRGSIILEDVTAVRPKCVFTTHTPVPAGHDQFPMDMVKRVLGAREEFDHLKEVFCHGDVLNMTYLALNVSHYVNGVAKKHGEVSRLMFGGYSIDSITNGVHAPSWVAEPFRTLFDRHIPGWHGDNFALRYAISIPKDEIWEAHQQVKTELLQRVNGETNAGMDVQNFTIGFARRATSYKRADLLLSDIDRLKNIAEQSGALQIIYAGKAHPRDDDGKKIIQHIFRMRNELRGQIKIAYLENYDMKLGQQMTSGVDIWLNTPQPPMEASGTSGMKAALNGVPSFSVLDGWWIEGCIEGITGWAIGEREAAENRSQDIDSLYGKLRYQIIPLFYEHKDQWIEVMRHAIAMNGSFFNTQRMLQQYAVKAYLE
jgi:starch phosphorylase